LAVLPSTLIARIRSWNVESYRQRGISNNVHPTRLERQHGKAKCMDLGLVRFR